MADRVTLPLTGGGDATAVVATDDAGAAGQVQIVKLAIATDGSATAIPADAVDGILVNLGANNDVTVTSGSITVTGVSTAARQDTGNTSLASLDTKLPAQGQALAAASVPVVLTAAQLTTLTPVTSVTANAGTNLNTSALALEAGGNLATLVAKDFATQTTLAALNTKVPAQGAALIAASLPVNIASNQTVPVSAASLPLPTGAATEATLATRLAPADTLSAVATVTNLAQLAGAAIAMNTGVRTAGTQRVTVATDDVVPASQSGVWNITNISGTVSLPTGAATAALQTQPGVDIGDVTVNNAAGASAVNIQDGGNSITVDAPVGTPVFVRLSDGSAAIATLPVSLASVPSHDVTNAGTFSVQPATATAAAPTYTEGASVKLSTDLTGAVRITGSISASSTATATAAAPAYTEAQVAAFSQDLAGNLRTRVSAIVSDATESYVDGDIKPLSLTTDGRLRTTVVNAPTYMEFFLPFDFGYPTDIRKLSTSPWSALS